MEMMIAIGGVLFSVFVLVSVYNGIVQRQHSVDQAWADVIASQRQFEQVVPNIEALSGTYSSYESGLLQAVVKLREALVDLNMDSSSAVSGVVMRQAGELLKSIHLSVEAYPDLKANQLVHKVITEVARIQDNVSAAIRIFNMNVASHNAGLEVFPNNVVNTILNKQKPFEPFDDVLSSSRFEYSPYKNQ